ncbi:hypothetical protein J2751_001723 [Halorubrum alkaliphilum]|uniref:Uncharacterized protein n=1 Tax=Halorubrum alkaliphilum TaxID=261290 RepID=A0A8T4GG60_9EURY|nr:hypothetical protein [Halorubrum alkaliphilum]MBP1922709.1 hypothetical protein [Halorubrum alkaliphilum]
MVSRDTKVHLGTVGITLLVLLSVEYAGLLPESESTIGVIALASYGAIFGGAHLYLAIRGDDGMVPAAARWRYVATLAVVLVAGVVYVVAGSVVVGPVTIGTVALAVAGVAAATYLVTESIDAYRSSSV